jgi:hypothetical protein
MKLRKFLAYQQFKMVQHSCYFYNPADIHLYLWDDKQAFMKEFIEFNKAVDKENFDK